MNEPADLERQLASIAEHAVAQSRAATDVTQISSPTRRDRPRRALVASAGLAAAAVVVALVVAFSSGGDGTRIDAGASTDPPVAAEYSGNVTVLESPEHGPQLCSAVMESYPPQCGGPDIVGWDWASVPTKESANGTTWGTYFVRGTWHDGVFTLTQPPTAPVPLPHEADTDFTTPCAALRLGEPGTRQPPEVVPGGEGADPEFAGAWWDPNNGVYNVAFTGHVTEHEATLRAAYADPLCVVQFEHTEASLLAAQDQLLSVSSRPLGIEVSGGWVDTVSNEIIVDALVADAATEAWVRDHLPEGIPFTIRAALVAVAATD